MMDWLVQFLILYIEKTYFSRACLEFNFVLLDEERLYWYDLSTTAFVCFLGHKA